ncbi:calcitonin gene-related peptide type 1 receptor-like isoform X5 [Planococcus citri]|uniref:calcitonin gene-related peptide type 1 receptor-like isoform X5 n=1 Tax=Planococcus citri TaxID=170843 RepID=UPI0031F9C3F9
MGGGDIYNDSRFAVGPSVGRILEERKQICNSEANKSISSIKECPQEFDGWTCVPRTQAGHISSFPCPVFVVGFDGKRSGHRPCLEDGTWFRHPESNKTWSNYTTCVDTDDLALRATVNSIYKGGYMLSLVALIISLFIFYYFRSLTCTRIQIHKNLFISLVVNNCLWLIWYETVVDDVGVLLENAAWCQLLHLLVQYFMVATYFWMFCEGLYLYTILVVTFLTESRVMACLYGIGWGMPAILVALYAYLRMRSSALETIHCWMEESIFSIALSIPVLVSMFANFVFLVNIVRLVVTKLPSSSAGHSITPHSSIREKSSFKLRNFRKSTISRSDSQEPSVSSGRICKAARATLILIPLLGLQYFMTPFRPEPGTYWEPSYQIMSAVVASGQGVCVALLFCFCNGEVISAIRRKYNQCVITGRRSWQPCSATTTVSLFFCCQFSRSSLMQHPHSNQQHIQLNQPYIPQPESEVVTPPSTLFHNVESVRNQKSVLL